MEVHQTGWEILVITSRHKDKNSDVWLIIVGIYCNCENVVSEKSFTITVTAQNPHRKTSRTTATYGNKPAY